MFNLLNEKELRSDTKWIFLRGVRIQHPLWEQLFMICLCRILTFCCTFLVEKHFQYPFMLSSPANNICVERKLARLSWAKLSSSCGYLRLGCFSCFQNQILKLKTLLVWDGWGQRLIISQWQASSGLDPQLMVS